jgi:polysaccharide biosynthesis protein VpsM
MTSKSRLALLTTVSAAPLFAAPFLAIGENSELFLTAQVQARYEDNVTLAEDQFAFSDEVFEFTPGAELVFGKSSLVKGSLSVYERLIAYSDNTSLNDQLFNAAFKSTYDGAKLMLSTNASFRELNQNNRDARFVDGLIRSDVTNLGLNGELVVTEKSKFGAGVQYTKTDYKEAGLNDQESYVVPLNYYFEVRPKLDVFAGLQYRATDVKSSAFNADSEDYYFNVGARGEFTPKLIGRFSTGYTLREFDASGVKDESLWGMDAGLTYLYSPKTQFNLNLSNDFSTGANGSGQEVASIAFGVVSEVAADLSAQFTLSYEQADYIGTDREDDFIKALVGLKYTVNEHLALEAGYTYMDNSSDLSPAEFDANIVTLSASLRY